MYTILLLFMVIIYTYVVDDQYNWTFRLTFTSHEVSMLSALANTRKKDKNSHFFNKINNHKHLKKWPISAIWMLHG